MKRSWVVLAIFFAAGAGATEVQIVPTPSTASTPSDAAAVVPPEAVQAAPPVEQVPGAALPPTPAAPPPLAVPQLVPAPPVDAVQLKASFDEGVVFSSPAHGFRAQIGVLAIGAVTGTLAGNSVHAGYLQRILRPQFRASALDGAVRLFVQPELAGTPTLLDAQLTFVPLSGLQIHVGQMVVSQSRGFMIPVPRMQMVDFGIVNDEFRVSRDAGIEVGYQFWSEKLEIHAGVYNGNSLKVRFDHGGMWLIRAEYSPFGSMKYDGTSALSFEPQALRLALAVHAVGRDAEQTQTIVDRLAGTLVTQPLPDQRDMIFGGDAQLAVWRVNVMAEAFARRRTSGSSASVDATGAALQGGIFVWPEHVELVSRLAALDTDVWHDGAGRRASADLGVNLYAVGNHLKFQGRIQTIATENGSFDYNDLSNNAYIQTQLFF